MEAERKDMISRETGGVDMRGIRERIEAIEAIEAGKKREEAERQAALLKRSKRSFRNSIIASAVFVLLTVVLFSAQTYAYFTDRAESSDNTIQAGNVNIDTVEVKGSSDVVTSVGDSLAFVPGASVQKIIKVKNSGTLPVYIRFSVKMEITSPNTIPSSWEEYVTFNVNTDLWEYKDGYYYYKSGVDAGATSSQLFSTVTFSPNMGNAFTDSTITITVTCESVQKNFNGNSYEDAVWPEN